MNLWRRISILAVLVFICLGIAEGARCRRQAARQSCRRYRNSPAAFIRCIQDFITDGSSPGGRNTAASSQADRSSGRLVAMCPSRQHEEDLGGGVQVTATECDCPDSACPRGFQCTPLHSEVAWTTDGRPVTESVTVACVCAAVQKKTKRQRKWRQTRPIEAARAKAERTADKVSRDITEVSSSRRTDSGRGALGNARYSLLGEVSNEDTIVTVLKTPSKKMQKRLKKAKRNRSSRRMARLRRKQMPRKRRMTQKRRKNRRNMKRKQSFEKKWNRA